MFQASGPREQSISSILRTAVFSDLIIEKHEINSLFQYLYGSEGAAI
jgi:hypothetical protein